MKTRRWVLTGMTIVLLAIATRSCVGCDGARHAPDAVLGGRFEKLCKLAERGIDDPVQGVRSMGAYLTAHTGDMLKNFGDTIAVVEQIADDQAHDERARVARGRLFSPIVACQDTWEQFALAVARDDEATALVERASERLSRTLAIIFAGSSFQSLRELPPQLLRALDRTLPTK